MTSVLLDLAYDVATGGTARAAGTLKWTPTARRAAAGAVVLPRGFTVTVTDAAASTVTVAATGATWCWCVEEGIPGGGTRYVAVPDTGSTVAYADLVDVDPKTLDPAVVPEAAWWVALEELAVGGVTPEQIATAVGAYLVAHPLTAADVGADPAGTAATAIAALDIPTTPEDIGAQPAGSYVLTNDSRLTNARTPTAHASSHAGAGADPVTLTVAQVTGLGQQLVAVSGNLQSAAYTLAATDAGMCVDVNSSSAVTITVPPSVLPLGAVVEVCQLGAGQVTIAPGAGVSLVSAAGLKTRAQYSTLSLRQRVAGVWVVSGDTVA